MTVNLPETRGCVVAEAGKSSKPVPPRVRQSHDVTDGHRRRPAEPDGAAARGDRRGWHVATYHNSGHLSAVQAGRRTAVWWSDRQRATPDQTCVMWPAAMMRGRPSGPPPGDSTPAGAAVMAALDGASDSPDEEESQSMCRKAPVGVFRSVWCRGQWVVCYGIRQRRTSASRAGVPANTTRSGLRIREQLPPGSESRSPIPSPRQTQRLGATSRPGLARPLPAPRASDCLEPAFAGSPAWPMEGSSLVLPAGGWR